MLCAMPSTRAKHRRGAPARSRRWLRLRPRRWLLLRPRRWLLLVLLPALACGGARPTLEAPPPPQPRTKVFAPLSIKQDAKAPDQAVILGTDAQGGSTILPIAGAPVLGVVHAMYGAPDGKGPAAGGTWPVKLSTSPNPGGAVQVGIHEEPPGGPGAPGGPGGPGARWRADVWRAAFAAASALGKDPTDLAFGASGASGAAHLDASSASGLLAGGFLATILGAKLDEAATMTGSINPDGTIGPIGPAAGIPEQFKAALAKGKKRLGYPIGIRMASSAETGELVDLVQLAKAGGAEAIAIADVRDAYRLLTGQPLPAPVPVTAPEMALDAAAAQALEASYRDWQQRLAVEWPAIFQLQQGGNLPRALIAMARQAQARGEDAERLHKRGATAAAYATMVEAWVLAAAATGAFDVLQKVRRNDLPAAAAAIDQREPLDRRTRELLAQLGAMEPTTMGGHLLMISAFQAALRGWGFQAFAADELARARLHLDQLAGQRPEERSTLAAADALVAAVAPAIVLLGRASAEAIRAQHRIAHEREETIHYLGSPPDVRRRAAWLAAAAAAGADDLDALLALPAAQRHGLPLEEARTRVAMDEPGYAVAYALSHLPARGGLPRELEQAWGEGSLSSSLLSLAASELAYLGSAELIAKHDATRGRPAPRSGAQPLALHEQALAFRIARAEQAARANARAARIATGSIPVQAKLAYQQASGKRGGGAGDKLEALAAYWRSSAYSRTAVMLARN